MSNARPPDLRVVVDRDRDQRDLLAAVRLQVDALVDEARRLARVLDYHQAKQG